MHITTAEMTHALYTQKYDPTRNALNLRSIKYSHSLAFAAVATQCAAGTLVSSLHISWNDFPSKNP
jgi:hypothetical protein